MEHEAITDRERFILAQAMCVVETDKTKMNLSGHSNNLPFRALEVRVSLCSGEVCASQEEIAQFFENEVVIYAPSGNF